MNTTKQSWDNCREHINNNGVDLKTDWLIDLLADMKEAHQLLKMARQNMRVQDREVKPNGRAYKAWDGTFLRSEIDAFLAEPTEQEQLL